LAKLKKKKKKKCKKNIFKMLLRENEI